MSCILSIRGKDLDIDDFISKSGLKPYKRSYKGQPRYKSKPLGEKLAFSSLSIVASEADIDDFDAQIKDTMHYLKKNKKKLRLIYSTKEVEHATIDFGIDLKIDDDEVLNQTNFFPNELLKLCGDLGLAIELSIYSKKMEVILEKRSNKNS